MRNCVSDLRLFTCMCQQEVTARTVAKRNKPYHIDTIIDSLAFLARTYLVHNSFIIDSISCTPHHKHYLRYISKPVALPLNEKHYTLTQFTVSVSPTLRDVTLIHLSRETSVIFFHSSTNEIYKVESKLINQTKKLN